MKIKKFFWALVAGALLGAILFAWVSPYLIVWYFSPPADLGVSCKPAVEWAIQTYRKVLLTGVLLGSIFSGIVYLAFTSGRGDGGGAQAVPPNSSDSV